MPSPVAHSIIGLSTVLGWLIPAGQTPRSLLAAAWNYRLALLGAVLLANMPDIDYLIGIPLGNLNVGHHLHVHSIGWVFLVAIAAWIILRRRYPGSALGLFVLLILLIGGHLLADVLTADCSYPRGMMLFWPFSDSFFYWPDVTVFPNLSKDSFANLFSLHNFRAVLFEALVTLPLLVLVLLRKCLQCPPNAEVDRENSG